MGRQLPILATPADERLLLAFMSSLSPIRVFGWFTEEKDELWIDDWEHRDINGSFNVWLAAFPWEPEYKQTGGPRCPKKNAGKWYIANSSTAPVIEISRPELRFYLHGGRVYWGRDFSAPDGLNYDADAFSKVVDRIWRWIRANGQRLHAKGNVENPYVLPHARHALELKREQSHQM